MLEPNDHSMIASLPLLFPSNILPSALCHWPSISAREEYDRIQKGGHQVTHAL